MGMRDIFKELYYWQYSNTGSFTNKLFDLICHADTTNRERIREGFPLHVLVWEDWQANENPDEFMESIKKGLI